MRKRNHGPPHGLRLGGHAAEGLGPERGRDHEIGQHVGRWHVVARAGKKDGVRRAQRLNPPLDAGAIIRVPRVRGAGQNAANALLDPRQRVEEGEMPLRRREPRRQHNHRPAFRHLPRDTQSGDAFASHARGVEGG